MGGWVHLFSVSAVSATLTVVVERTSSVLTHLVHARVVVTLNPDPLTQLPVGDAPPRGGEGQSSRVSCFDQKPVRAQGTNGVGVIEERRGDLAEPCKDNGGTSKVNWGGQVLENWLSSQCYGYITI